MCRKGLELSVQGMRKRRGGGGFLARAALQSPGSSAAAPGGRRRGSGPAGAASHPLQCETTPLTATPDRSHDFCTRSADPGGASSSADPMRGSGAASLRPVGPGPRQTGTRAARKARPGERGLLRGPPFRAHPSRAPPRPAPPHAPSHTLAASGSSPPCFRPESGAFPERTPAQRADESVAGAIRDERNRGLPCAGPLRRRDDETAPVAVSFRDACIPGIPRRAP